ncbi:MAG: galactose-1-phosphate uridylyltransferase, partial [SAR324 cluster bacterium]|nr:galactose-1-phosphate uridylyltransferase [SAR324 cluster bacterium]
DFPALYEREELTEASGALTNSPSFIRMTSEEGLCRVICFSPRHDLTLPQMEVSAIRAVINIWDEQTKDLMSHSSISHVMIFENKGEIMGCSNPHPHGQIWSSKFIPNIPWLALNAQDKYFKAHGTLLLKDYLDWEISERERIVCENDAWVALIPFWAEWPFEVMILPRRAVRSISGLKDSERDAWAALMKELLIRYDNLFETSFPYSMGVYQAPKGWIENKAISLYQVFLPPLLRSATIKKFMVGFELTAEVQRDITAETAADRLRAVSTRYFRER